MIERTRKELFDATVGLLPVISHDGEQYSFTGKTGERVDTGVAVREYERTSPFGPPTHLGRCRGYPTNVLRAAVVADWQGKPDLSAIMEDDVHLLLTAGDNIANLWQKCGEGNKDCVKPYMELIDAYPELFRSTPFMPVLGNHDQEIRPRGSEPPAEPVYDVDATAFTPTVQLPSYSESP